MVVCICWRVERGLSCTKQARHALFQVPASGSELGALRQPQCSDTVPCQCLKRRVADPAQCPSLPVPPTFRLQPQSPVLVVQPLKQELWCPTHNFVVPRRRYCCNRNLEFPMSAALSDSTLNMWPHRRDWLSGYCPDEGPTHVSRVESNLA